MQVNILTVTQLSKIVKETVEKNPSLSSLLVKGELSNVTYHSSGHIYLTLKDKSALISAAFFKYANKSCKIRLEDGMSIIAEGSISVYEKRGSYQLVIKSIVPDGIGEIQLQIEQLKKKLSEEGIFNPERKKALPRLPKKIGVVTSPTGAAYRDILKVLINRFPNIEVLLAPAKVQGDDAPETIVRAIKELNKTEYNVDLIIAGRGGGSFEDLLPFNDEAVVRAYAESEVPIISAVGHQIDHPLSDDAADAYAPTPSAAAELAVPVKHELAEIITFHAKAIDTYIIRMVEHYSQRVGAVKDRRAFSDPMLTVSLKQMQIDELKSKIHYSVQKKLSHYRENFAHIPDLKIRLNTLIKEKKFRFAHSLSAIEQLSPLKVLARGYTAVKDSKNEFIKSVSSLNVDDSVNIFFKDGKASCTINSISGESIIGKEK
jgi:exodeoxyribonuclease VII large subunit